MLTLAAVKGGSLKLTVTQALLDGRTSGFNGVSVNIALEVTARQEQFPLFIAPSDFTEGGSDEEPVSLDYFTAPTYSRTISIPLYPQGSTETGGFVLQQGAASYAFQIGTDLAGVDFLNLTFDDLEVVVKADLAIIYEPVLASGPAGFVGRLLTNALGTAVYSATGLPAGITIDPVTGLISGIPTEEGTFNVVFSVTEDGVTVSTGGQQWVIANNVIATITAFSSNGATATITWAGTASTPVTVQRSTTLLEESWVPISTGNIAGTYTDFDAPDAKAFYRVVTP